MKIIGGGEKPEATRKDQKLPPVNNLNKIIILQLIIHYSPQPRQPTTASRVSCVYGLEDTYVQIHMQICVGSFA